MHKLYTFWRSSASYRVRIALNLKGLDYESIPIHFRKDGGQHKQPDFLVKNPQGLLPVLQTDGEHLLQSLAIIQYLDETHPDVPLIPRAPLARARVNAMAQLIACEIHPVNNLRVLQYLRQQLGQDDEGVKRWVQHWVGEGLRALETLVCEQGDGKHCFGDSITLADVCLVPQVYNAERFGCDLSQYPTLCGITEHLRGLQSFARAAPEQQADAEL
ncbi:maleylacetoacetate isomerase [Pseudomaricurvus alkylphenolicus]|uniref:maleylacetoacetate isomerase n=1 Tax=Pseudomaricurvus alkylphenolicus TaxID=1306991 RepID=UPI0014210804|nr:maleylacetoacetate isomerase [Pseudomaricurvus alkylphenolicus]NIB38256.1 maleylacetoacetate isomerase [Pseudomaricurvus alkylphenolicus]